MEHFCLTYKACGNIGDPCDESLCASLGYGLRVLKFLTLIT